MSNLGVGGRESLDRSLGTVILGSLGISIKHKKWETVYYSRISFIFSVNNNKTLQCYLGDSLDTLLMVIIETRCIKGQQWVHGFCRFHRWWITHYSTSGFSSPNYLRCLFSLRPHYFIFLHEIQNYFLRGESCSLRLITYVVLQKSAP